MKHLSRDFRLQIEALGKAGHSQQRIAKIIGFHQSSISRELKRNSSEKRKQYNAEIADKKSTFRRNGTYKEKSLFEQNPSLREYVINELRDKKSPDQIAGRLKREKKKQIISHQSIYNYIKKDKNNGGKLYKYLRYQGKKFKWRGFGGSDQGRIPNRKGIELRPAIVDQKKRCGDWESDLVVSNRECKRAIATFVERTTMYFRATLVEDRSSEEMVRATHHALGDIPEEIRITMTHDNGKEISQHEKISQELKIDIYCARPYHSWERGLNEFMNRELRRFFPKGMSFAHLTQKNIDQVVFWLNNCPRRSLNYRTPLEALTQKSSFMHFTL